MRNSAFDPAVRMALAAGGALGKRLAAVVFFGKTPIMLFSNEIVCLL